MAEYISKDEVINITAETGAWETQNRVRELPAADVQPVRRGRWIEHHDLIRCSVCGFEVKDEYHEKRDMTSTETSYDFCPKCGAKIKEG